MLKNEFNEAITVVFADKALISNNICRIDGNNYIIFYNNLAIIKSDVELDKTKLDNKNNRLTHTKRVSSVEDFVDHLIAIKEELYRQNNTLNKDEVVNLIYTNISSDVKDYNIDEKRNDYLNKLKYINELLTIFDNKLNPYENNLLTNKETLKYLNINASLENYDKYSFEIKNKQTGTSINIINNVADTIYSIKARINDNATIDLRHYSSEKHGNNVILIETIDNDEYLVLNYNFTNNLITKRNNSTEPMSYVSLELIKDELELAIELIDDNLNEKINQTKKLTR